MRAPSSCCWDSRSSSPSSQVIVGPVPCSGQRSRYASFPRYCGAPVWTEWPALCRSWHSGRRALCRSWHSGWPFLLTPDISCPYDSTWRGLHVAARERACAEGPPFFRSGPGRGCPRREGWACRGRKLLMRASSRRRNGNYSCERVVVAGAETCRLGRHARTETSRTNPQVLGDRLDGPPNTLGRVVSARVGMCRPPSTWCVCPQ